jgi:uncharacterized RDD family membrane protein YckC
MAVYRFAGFWRRLVAYTIDNVIISIIFTVLFTIVLIAFFTGAMSGDERNWASDLMNPQQFLSVILTVTALYLALYIAYFTYFHGMNGRTPGKMLLGLQVLSKEGTPVTFGTAFLRSVGYLISSLLFTIPVGFIWAAFDGKKQGWHDKIAGTVVIIRPPENEAAGLTIPEPQATLNILQKDNSRTETVSQVAIQPIELGLMTKKYLDKRILIL